MKLRILLFKFWSKICPKRKITYIEGDTIPEKITSRNLFIAVEDNEIWSVAFKCPCGCGDRLELMSLQGVKPRWDVHIHKNGTASLTPSIWRKTNCGSHFWFKQGRIVWCDT